MFKINNTKMLSEAKESLKNLSKPRILPVELLFFALVFAVSSIPVTILQSVFTIPLFFSAEFIESVTSAATDFNAIIESTENLMSNLPSWYTALTILTSGFYIISAIFYCKHFEKRNAATLGFRKKSAGYEYISGLIIGLTMISITVLIGILFNAVEIRLSDTISPGLLLLFFIAFMLQGMGEEALFRGYLMITIAKRSSPWTAVIINSLLFSLFHVMNPNFNIIAFVNIFLFGIFVSVYMLKRGSIWAVGAIHAIWNFAQGNIFGFNVSGISNMSTLFESSYSQSGQLISGGSFGPEGGLATTLILTVFILIALLLPTKKSEALIPSNAEMEEYIIPSGK